MAQVKEKEESQKAQVFYEAVSAGQFDEILEIFKKTQDRETYLDTRHGYYKETALLTATWQKHYHIVALLLQYKADVNAQNHVGRSSLMHAAINDDIETLKLLLNNGANIHAVDRCGMSALHFAAKSSSSGNAVKLLIDAGANVHAQCAATAYTWFFQSIDRDLQTQLFTPLHFAALACNADTVTLLIKNGAKPHEKDGKSRTPLQLVVYHAQHFGVPYRENFFKTRERLKRFNSEFPPAAQQIVKREATPVPMVEEEEELDLTGIRKGLIRVRNDLVKDYKSTSEKFQHAENEAEDLKEIADTFERQTTHRVAEATEYINAAIAILKENEITDPFNEYTYHRVFSFVAKDIGSKKGNWQTLCTALFAQVEGIESDRVIKDVWAHSTTEIEAAHEVLVRWKHYVTNPRDDVMAVKLDKDTKKRQDGLESPRKSFDKIPTPRMKNGYDVKPYLKNDAKKNADIKSSSNSSNKPGLRNTSSKSQPNPMERLTLILSAEMRMSKPFMLQLDALLKETLPPLLANTQHEKKQNGGVGGRSGGGGTGPRNTQGRVKHQQEENDKISGSHLVVKRKQFEASSGSNNNKNVSAQETGNNEVLTKGARNFNGQNKKGGVNKRGNMLKQT